MGTGPVHVSYLCIVGEAGAVTSEMSVGSTGSVEADSTSGSPVPWLGEGGLERCREDELWPLRGFAIAAAWMDEGFRRGGGGGWEGGSVYL